MRYSTMITLATLLLVTLASLLIVSAGLAALVGEGYDLSWWTVDGGGGFVSDETSGYTLGSTIGQPDAAAWDGSGYTLTGGFWGGALVEYHIYLPLVLRDF